MRSPNQTGRESGSVLIGVLFILMLLGGIAGAMYVRSTSSSKAASRNTTETRLLMTAESGLNVAFSRLQVDPLYAVKNAAAFDFDAAAAEYQGRRESVDAGGTKMEFTLTFQYSKAGVPVAFASRPNPKESWDLLQVTSVASVAGLERRVANWYEPQVGEDYSAAIISDAKTSGKPKGGGKGQAQAGDVVLDDKNSPSQFVFGGIRANGAVFSDGSGGLTPLTTQNAPLELAGWTGEVSDKLGGSAGEIPDFTGSTTDQLFDFDAYEAAAAAGAGKVYADLEAFKDAMNNANLSGKPLEGIIVVKSDPKTDFDLLESKIPGGINVRGCLVFRFKPGIDPLYKITITAAMNVNAVDLSAWVPANEATWPIAYPPVYTLGTKQPHEVDISPAYPNFDEGDDMPALMFETGVIDLNGSVNISGAVYSPSFIEVENKKAGDNQYINGIVIGGAGIYFEGRPNKGYQGIKFTRACIDQLATSSSRLKTLVRTRFAILK